MRVRLLIGVGLATVAVGASAEQAMACSCAAPEKKLSFKPWDGAVTARLLDVERHRPQDRDATYTYKVRRVFKGRHAYGLHRGFRLRIESSIDGASCGLPRRKRPLYGLLLYEARDGLQANLCTLTSPRSMRRAAERRREANPTSRKASSRQLRCATARKTSS